MIMKYLDYIYYRVTKAYIKTRGESGITGILSVSLIVIFYIFDIFSIIHYTFLSEKIGNNYLESAKIFGYIFAFIILIVFYFRYREKYKKLELRWGKETKKQRLGRGVLVIISLIFPIIFLILYLNIFRFWSVCG